MRLKVHWDGPEAGPVVVLLHAIATNAEMWQPQLPVLAQRFRTARIDLPGHGGSPLCPGAGIGDFADAVVSTLDQEGVDDFNVVGLSLGAMVATRIAAQHGERVHRAVIASAAAKPSEQAAAVWRARIESVQTGGIAGQTAETLSRWFTPPFASRSPHTLDWVRGMIESTSEEGFIDAAAAIADLDNVALLSTIRSDCLVVAGSGDTAVPMDAVRGLSAALPHASFVELPAGHLANIETPVEFSELVSTFLARPRDS